MNEQEEIRQLRQELDALKDQLVQQHRKVMALQQRINQLGGFQEPLEKKGAPEPFSLENFIGLRLIHFIGIVVLVIGLSIGVKYAIDRQLISESLRIGLAYGAGALLYLLSLRLRAKYSLFSAILFSGGMASLYFTTYAAYSYYHLVSFGLAYFIMVLMTVYTVFEAIRYNRQEIALLALVGAYGIPFLISQNSDRADLLFLYVSLINSGIVFLCIRKRWKNVGRVAQLVTWVLFLAWASTRFHPETQKPIGLIFMVFFFILFHLAALASRIFHKKAFTLNDNYQLVMNNIALYIAALFVFGFADNSGLAPITLLVAAIVGLQGFLSYHVWKEELVLTRMLSSLALIFFVLFITFNWTGFIVTLLWLLTAVVVFTWGFLRRSVAARMAAIILIGVTLGKLLAFDSLTFTPVQKVIAYLVLGVLLLIVSFFYQKFKQYLFSKGEE